MSVNVRLTYKKVQYIFISTISQVFIPKYQYQSLQSDVGESLAALQVPNR